MQRRFDGPEGPLLGVVVVGAAVVVEMSLEELFNGLYNKQRLNRTNMSGDKLTSK